MNLSITPNPRVTFTIRHEDDDVIVVEKPAHLVTQPGKGHEDDTLLNGLFARGWREPEAKDAAGKTPRAWGARLQNLGRARDFGLLHRLDRQTSGLLLVALSPRAYDVLRADFEHRRIRKFYWALTRQAPKKPVGVIRRPILEETDEKKTARISSAGKPALTAYRVLQSSHTGALVECRPVTGRLHQVRVHLDSIGCPVLGDDLYGPRGIKSAAPRLALHAHRLVFKHPVTNKTIDVRSPWPKDLAPLLKRLGLSRPTDVSPAKSAHEGAGDTVGEEEPGVGESPAEL